jgi:ABC-type Fe3+-siderophore transport system permease subunit
MASVPRQEVVVPVLIVCLVLAVLLGMFAPRGIALALTAVAAAATVFVFVWAVADGKGDDPWWLILVGVAVGAVSIAICALLSAGRVRRAIRT